MTFLFLTSDRLGAGDDDLGRTLMRNALASLAASGTRIDHVVCVNAAVLLSTREGPALESLRRIEASGARVASCGTCLKHHGLADELRVGFVGTMDETVQLLATADRVIRL